MVKNIVLFAALLLLGAACKDKETIETQEDFLSKDDSNPDIVRKFKQWKVVSGTYTKAGQATISYTSGQAVMGKFDPSKISFLLNNNPKSFNGTDITGRANSGAWEVNSNSGYFRFSSSTDGIDSLKIESLDRNQWVAKTEEIDELDNKKVVITLTFKAQL
jgi:hypothetical protein